MSIESDLLRLSIENGGGSEWALHRTARAAAEEITRLRERVGELEASGKDKLILLENEVRHREHFEEQSKLLLEAVRWCIDHGITRGAHEELQALDDDGYSYDIDPPEHLAPLIAEAVKQQEQQ